MRFSGIFVIVVALFVTVLITSNIIAVKLIHIATLPFQFLGDNLVFMPAGIIVFPVSYIIGDVLTEVYGFRTARGVIWLGFACNLLVALLLWLGGIIPPEVFWQGQDAYNVILGQVPWILLGSFSAYLVGEFSNSATLAFLKFSTRGRFLWVRTISSTIIGQGFDSFVFIFIAFGVGGDLTVEQLLRTVLFQWWAKIAYEVLATPLTYAVVAYLKRKEQMDVYDAPRSLNPLGVFA
jgi:uncharacterized integral membrane protein (TIGR00697 family)